MSNFKHERFGRTITIREGEKGHSGDKIVALNVKHIGNEAMILLEPEDAPAVALAILEAAGRTDKNDGGKLGAACLNLRGYVDGLRAEAEREAEDAKVDAWRSLKPLPGQMLVGWKCLSEYERNEWRDDYRAARDFFKEQP